MTATSSTHLRDARGRGDPHHARGRRRVRAARAAVLRRQGLDRAAAPRREGVPARRASRSRSCTSTPATTSPRSSSSATAASRELGERLIVASVQESIDDGPRRRGDRAARVAQPAADHDAARRDRRARLRRRVRRRAPRRGEGARQGAGLLASATTSASGTRRTSGPSCGTSTTAASARASTSACSRSRTGPSSTSGSTSPSEEPRAPVDLLRARARGVPRATGCSTRRQRLHRADGRRGAVQRVGALPHRRRHDRAPARSSRRPATLEDVVDEIAATRITERGETRADDRVTEAAMEDRKREGYF